MATDTAPQKQHEANAPNSTRSGKVYLVSAGDSYKAPQITARKLKQYSKNVYGAGVSRKLLTMFFSQDPEIEVTNKAGKRNEKIEKEMENMATAPEVQLFSKMRMGWIDKFWFGMAFFNPVWEYVGNFWKIVELRRLPPESFASSAKSISVSSVGNAEPPVLGSILKGVVAMPDGIIRYFQTSSSGQDELKEIYTIKESISPEVGGEPDILPVIPLITMLDFSWKAQMQKNNRVAAPILILTITNPKGDDVEYGNKLIKNWGKDTGFMLRSNMVITEFDPHETNAALETIDKLTEMFLDYWIPTSMLSKNGQLIGGNSNSDLNLLYSYIAGIHREIEKAWEPLLQIYLEANGYVGYRAKLRIPDPQIDDSEIKIKQAELGVSSGRLTDNEIRERLGAPEMSEEDLAKLPCNKKAAASPAAPAVQPNEQDPNTPDQAGSQDDQDPASLPPDPAASEEWQEVKEGTPGALQDKKTKKWYKLTHSHKGVNPDPVLTKLEAAEIEEFHKAIDTLAKNIMKHL